MSLNLQNVWTMPGYAMGYYLVSRLWSLDTLINASPLLECSCSRDYDLLLMKLLCHYMTSDRLINCHIRYIYMISNFMMTCTSHNLYIDARSISIYGYTSAVLDYVDAYSSGLSGGNVSHLVRSSLELFHILILKVNCLQSYDNVTLNNGSFD